MKFLPLLLSFVFCLHSHAAIVVTTGSGNSTLTITEQINITVTQNETARFLVFSNWVSSDGTTTNAAPLLPVPASLAFSINSVSDTSPLLSFVDNSVPALNDITINSGYLQFSDRTVSNGDLFVITVQSWMFNPPANFNSEVYQTFTGDVFLASSTGQRISNLTPVPEPSVYALGLGVLVLGVAGVRRWRKQKAA